MTIYYEIVETSCSNTHHYTMAKRRAVFLPVLIRCGSPPQLCTGIFGCENITRFNTLWCSSSQKGLALESLEKGPVSIHYGSRKDIQLSAGLRSEFCISISSQVNSVIFLWLIPTVNHLSSSYQALITAR